MLATNHPRRIVGSALALALGLLAGLAILWTAPPATGETAQLENATQWSGDVALNGSQTVGANDVVSFDPAQDTTVEIAGNLVVEGTLEMKPQPGISHTLRFVGVDESVFVGGGMAVLETDRGLWVMGEGQLDIVGQTKTGWNRTGDDSTWESGDELRVAPSVRGDYAPDGFATFDTGASVPQAEAVLPATEVINLTRSVSIEGTPGGRSHVAIMSGAPQTIRFAQFVHMGPRQATPDGFTEGVAGRYPIHFHHAGDGSRGSMVEGNVIRQSGHRAIVPHASHGITLVDNVAYDVFDTPYWWDPGEENATHDSVWEHNFAGYIQHDPEFRGFTMSGFDLGRGDGNQATDNAAAGILGSKNCSGFHWPSQGSGLWLFEGDVAHNNKCHGIFVWQNSSPNHVISDFVAYHNGNAGVSHGAYTNNYVYKDLLLWGNEKVGVIDHAFAHNPKPGVIQQAWSCVTVVDSPVGLSIAVSNAPEIGAPALFDSFLTVDVDTPFSVTDAALAKGQDLSARADLVDPGHSCGRFIDDDGNVHEAAIEAIAIRGVTVGCNPPVFDRFCPESSLTREQMAAFFVRALELPTAATDFFADDNGSIYEQDINRLAAAGITRGCNPPTADQFCGEETITREEMAAFLVRALDLPGASTGDLFDDDESIFENDIDSLAESGITRGCDPPANVSFCPSDSVRRDEMASFLGRALGYDPIPVSPS